MKNIYRPVTFLLCLTFLISSCSRKKDRFLNRNWHTLNTKYNVLFNGEMALIEGHREIEASYKDNYWKILPIERLGVKKAFSFDENPQSPNFERAEEKAIKAVQTHGMKIKGKEKNTQIDEAYILLGKARYFSGRFIPAIEAFNYVLFKYPGSSNINAAKIWRAKTNLRLENEAVVLKNLNSILSKNNISDENKVEAHATLAQAFINLEVSDSAIVHLKKAAEITKDDMLKGRLHFIRGQLYNKKGFLDSANSAFQKVIDLKRKLPRAYRVNAFLEQIKNFDYNQGNLSALSEFFKTLVEDRENRPYLDRIYYFMANHHLTLEKDSMAIVYYNKSLRTKSQDLYLNALNYHSIADLYFEASNYSLAGSYYDSTLTNYSKNTKPYRQVKKRLDNLQDVILYEGIARTNDSILNLLAMPKEALNSFFINHIETLKEKEKEEKERDQEKRIQSQGTDLKTDLALLKNNKGGGFYFYQSTTVAYGRGEFSKLWGARPLEDNWRWSVKKILEMTEGTMPIQTLEFSITETLTPMFFIDQLPKKPEAIDSIFNKRNFAYYQLGLIYKNKFKDYKRSKDKLEALLEQNPEERLILPAKYNLYKIYVLLNNALLAKEIKQHIIQDYSGSLYAQILSNPSEALEDNSQTPQARYKGLFKAFERANYQEVIEGCEIEIIRYDGEAIVPKLELLKASAIGRLYGFSEYKASLSYIALNYPNSPEGKQAQDLTENLLETLEKSDFETMTSGNNFKTIFKFSNKETDAINALKTTLKEAIRKEEVFGLSLSEDIYDINTTFVVIHGLKSMSGALGFAELLELEASDIVEKSYFAISSTNYQTLQVHKNLENYLKTIKN